MSECQITGEGSITDFGSSLLGALEFEINADWQSL